MEKSYLRRIYWQLTGVIMAAVIMALAGLSYFTHKAFERELVPEVARKAATVAASVSTLMLRAVGYGIEYRSLYGVEQIFDEVRGENPDFSYIAATDERGTVLFHSGTRPEGARAHFASPAMLRAASSSETSPPTLVSGQYLVSLPIAAADKPLGMLHIGISQGFVQSIMLEVLLDVVVVLVVALFFTLELLHFMAGARLAAGFGEFASTIARVKGGNFGHWSRVAAQDESGRVLRHVNEAIQKLNENYRALSDALQERLRNATLETRERLREAAAAVEALRQRFRFGVHAPEQSGRDEGALTHIRAPLFVFILAEELTRSFLPTYTKLLLVPLPGISPHVVIGLPIVLFMLIVALGQPGLGAWSERVGRKRALMVGAVIGSVGFFATALAYNMLDLLVWRSLAAVGYAIVFVAAQGYVLENTRPQNRAQGFALFVGAIMVATICGPSIGGILADNIGYRPSFAVSAVLCALSIFAIRTLPEAVRRPGEGRAERSPSASDFARLLLNRRFMTLVGLAAIPAKIILIGFCFYLVPLYVVSAGSTQAMAGRMLMVYAMMMVALVPVAARMADLGARREQLVALGLTVSGLGGLLLLVSGSFVVVFGVVLLLGLGQAISIASQSALVGDLCREEVQRLGDGPVYGVYRMLERFGNALGPLLAGLLVVWLGYVGAFVAIGALVVVCGILFTLATGAYRRAAAAPA